MVGQARTNADGVDVSAFGGGGTVGGLDELAMEHVPFAGREVKR